VRVIRSLVADKNPAVCDGLCSIIETQPDMKIVGSARDISEAMDKARKLHPEIILVDAGIPEEGGIEATRRIKKDIPGVKILILTTHPGYMRESFEAGADGYLMKDCCRSELFTTIREITEKRPAAC